MLFYIFFSQFTYLTILNARKYMYMQYHMKNVVVNMGDCGLIRRGCKRTSVTLKDLSVQAAEDICLNVFFLDLKHDEVQQTAQKTDNKAKGNCGQLQSHSTQHYCPGFWLWAWLLQIIDLTMLCAVSKEPFNLQAVEMITCTMFCKYRCRVDIFFPLIVLRYLQSP